jgi:hypothetical protein
MPVMKKLPQEGMYATACDLLYTAPSNLSSLEMSTKVYELALNFVTQYCECSKRTSPNFDRVPPAVIRNKTEVKILAAGWEEIKISPTVMKFFEASLKKWPVTATSEKTLKSLIDRLERTFHSPAYVWYDSHVVDDMLGCLGDTLANEMLEELRRLAFVLGEGFNWTDLVKPLWS